MSKVQGRSLRTPVFSPTSLYPQTQRLNSETRSLVHAGSLAQPALVGILAVLFLPPGGSSPHLHSCTCPASPWTPLSLVELTLPGLLTLLRIFLWLPVYTAESPKPFGGLGPVCPQVLYSRALSGHVQLATPSQCASLCTFPFVPVFAQVCVALSLPFMAVIFPGTFFPACFLI